MGNENQHQENRSFEHCLQGIYTLRYSNPVIFSERDLNKRDIIEREIPLNETVHENSVYLLIFQNGVKIGGENACQQHINLTLGYIFRTG